MIVPKTRCVFCGAAPGFYPHLPGCRVNQPALFDPAQTQPQSCPVGHCQAIRLAGQQGQLPTCAHDLDREHGHKRPQGCLNTIDPATSDWGGY